MAAKEFYASDPKILAGIRHFRDLKKTHIRLYEWMISVRQAAMNNQMDMELMVDAAMVAKRISEMLDDSRKEQNILVVLLSELVCTIWTTKGMSDPTSVRENIRGGIGTGTPDMGQIVHIPKKETPEYRIFMNALGIPPELIESGALKIDWPGMCDYVFNLTKAGKPLPKGLDATKTRPKYKLTLRQRVVQGEIDSVLDGVESSDGASEDSTQTATENNF